MRIINGRGLSLYLVFILSLALFTLQSCEKDPKEMTRQELETELGEKSYGEILEFSKNAGIDITKFGREGNVAPVFDLLEEAGYGHKPALRYTEKRILADTAAIRDAVENLVKGEAIEKVMEKIEPSFPVYSNLKIHYARLVKEGKKDSATLVSSTLNAYRWIRRQSQGAPRFVMVNIRGAYLTATDSSGKNAITMRAIVGKSDTPTPTIDTYATSIVTHPYWNVPKSIAIKEIFPKAMADPEYLAKNQIEIIDNKGEAVDPEDVDWEEMTAEKFPYRFRQETGEDNSLGLLKVEIKNPLAIYLHDTNARYLFKSSQRWRSHGCVRVERPTDLANYMAGTKLLDNDFLTEPDTVAIPPKWHKLQNRIPVFLLYLGADCNEQGDLLYFDDVYRKES